MLRPEVAPSAAGETSAMTLLREIQAAALDSTSPLADLLRKCKVLAARLKNKEFGEWVNQELNGYDNRSELPTYRVIATQSCGNLVGTYGRQMNNLAIPATSFPKEFQSLINRRELTMSVAALAEMANTDETVLRLRWPPELIAFASSKVTIVEDMSLVDGWQFLPVSHIKQVLDIVRTRILEFVLAIEEQDPAAGDALPGAPAPIPPATVTNIFHTSIYGGAANVGTSGRAKVSVGSIQFSPAIPQRQRAKITKLVGELAEQANEIGDESDRGEAQSALEKVTGELATSAPNAAKISRQLALYASIVTSAAKTVEQLQHLLGPLFQ